jgi:hypothetical protein
MTESDRAIAVEIRRSLLIILRAIEAKYGLGPQEPRQTTTSGPREPITPRR